MLTRLQRHDALMSGAFARDLEPEQPPRGATDPMWYLIADHLCPLSKRDSRRKVWIEGFLWALEAVRGDDGEIGVAQVLRGTLDGNIL